MPEIKTLEIIENFDHAESKIEYSAELRKVNNLSCTSHLPSKKSWQFSANSVQMVVSPSVVLSSCPGKQSPRGQGLVARLLCSIVVWGLELDFPALPSSVLRGKLWLSPVFPKVHVIPARDTQLRPLGLISQKAALPNTSGHLPGSALSLEAAQIHSWNEAQGASWVRAKSAGNQLRHHPSPRVGLRMAGSGMLKTPSWPAEHHQGPGAGSCWAAQVPGGRSTVQRCSGGPQEAARLC